MSRRRVRSVEYRQRRQKRHATRHYFVDEPLGCCPDDPGVLDSTEADHAIEVSVERGNQSVSP